MLKDFSKSAHYMYLSTKSIEKCFKKCADLAANFELHGVEPGLLLAELELQLLLQRRRHALLLPVPFVHLAGTSRAAAFCSKKKSGKKNRMTCSFQIGVSNTEVLINAAHLRFNMRPLSKQKSCFQHQSCFWLFVLRAKQSWPSRSFLSNLNGKKRRRKTRVLPL